MNESGIRRIPAEESTLVTEAMLNDLLKDVLEGGFPDGCLWYLINRYDALLKLVDSVDHRAAYLLPADVTVPAQHPHCFQQNKTHNCVPGIVYYIQGPIKFKDGPVRTIIICIGSPSLQENVHDYCLKSDYFKDQFGVDLVLQVCSWFRLRASLCNIHPDHIVYKTTGDGLFKILREPHHRIFTRVTSTLLLLFPYIETALSTIAIVENLVPPGQTGVVNPLLGSGMEGDNTMRDNLISLVLYTLGPAYAQKRNIYDQICQKTRIIAAALNLRAPNTADVASVARNTCWKVDPPIKFVENVLGMAIAVDENLRYDVNLANNELASDEHLQVRGGVGKVGLEIMKQARLAYANYQTTSIRFIPPFLTAMRKSFKVIPPFFDSELAKYKPIEKMIITSPYIGLCTYLPAQYHIRNFPMLVYGGLKYHERSLATPADVVAFQNYKMNDIKKHIRAPGMSKLIEDLSAVI